MGRRIVAFTLGGILLAGVASLATGCAEERSSEVPVLRAVGGPSALPGPRRVVRVRMPLDLTVFKPGRDPFEPPAGRSGENESKGPSKPCLELEGLRVTGIITGIAEPVAMVDGGKRSFLLRTGAVVGGHKVERILRDQVVLTRFLSLPQGRHKQRVVLRLRSGGGKTNRTLQGWDVPRCSKG